ncbi:aminopeptidase N [Trebonia kvetii]|uniref:Aminopeptidase N n=1 Tax=Trebonia kvetii TaxID=2480626 RepID=A0A6P2C5D4_9ACTN|nr:aminopeptidase N [Trebonia kvetii]TVZ06207.1 aminopeptidase N [Trebonia kvetii]
MAVNLTREEARTRAESVAVDSYQVELDLTGGDTTFRSVSTIEFACSRPGSATFLNLAAPRVHAITLNGRPVGLDAFDGERIALDGLAERNVAVIDAECGYSRSGEGLHRFTDPADGNVYMYSDLETFDAHRIYACFDQPDMKASYELTVLAPQDWYVVSNMAPVTEGGVPQADGVHRWQFPPTPVMSTYITHVSAGPWHIVRSEHDGIPLGIFCRQSLARYLDPEEIFEVTRQGFDFFHEAFGIRYPFGKYDQLFVPEFKEGAMENAGAVTFLEDYVFRSRVTDFSREARGETILHEMAHMWFGDLVTMRWWDDLWLNESFATWAGTEAQAKATRWHHSWTTFTTAWKAWACKQDQLPSTHPIAADIPDIHAVEVNFDGITYAKGAAVLKQLVAYVGYDNFLAGVRAYFAAHSYGNATLADLLSALEEVSGRDLGAWSQEWLETAGVNTLRPSYSVDDSGRFTAFSVLQSAAPSHPTLRSHRIAIGLYSLADGALTRVHSVETDVTGDWTPVPELVGMQRPDLVLINDDDLTYAKIRLDPHSLDTAVTSVGSFTSSLPAALVWAASWDMVRDGEMAARDYARLVAGGVDSVRDISVVQTLLRQATLAVRQYADPSWRGEGLAFLASALRSLLEAAPAGSDHQLAYVRAFTSVATSAADLEYLTRLLDGTVALDGLAVDTDLRWALLRRLVSRGVRGEDAIDAELSRDATDAGERQAAGCRAAIPTVAAKRETWEELTDGKLTIAMFRATIASFADPDQPELVQPYRDEYFAAIGAVWAEWSSAMAQDFVEYGYTIGAVDEATIAATDAYLIRPEPPAALRRLLVEGRDEVARALRNQARDKAAAV